MAQAVGAALLGSVGLGSVAAGSILGVSTAYIVGNVVISAVASWALRALAPPARTAGGRGVIVNAREAAAPQEFVYGEVRKGGIVTFYETTGTNNKFLHQIIVLAGHRVEQVGDIYINDEIVTLDSNGFVTGSRWKSQIRIYIHLGNQTSASTNFANVATNLRDTLHADTSVDPQFIGRGIAYLYVRYAYDSDVFANGVPLISAVVRGRRVFDPRTSTTAWSNNAALCIRNYITSAFGLDDDAVDDTYFSAAADACDENVALAAGGTEKRYTINGVVRADQNYGDVLQQMTTACAGTLFWGTGKWRLKAGVYTAPVKTFTLADLRGPISVNPRTNLRDQFNIVQGTFVDAAQRWITADYEEFRSAPFIAEDGGEELPLDLELPFTTSAATARRLAKLTLFRSREQITVEADFSLAALDVEVGDIIALTNDRYGWTAKEFEVVSWRLFADRDAGDLRIRLSLRETSAAAFDWNAEESAILSNNTTLLPYDSVPTVGIPAEDINSFLRIVREKLTEIISINVTAGDSSAVDYVEVQYREVGASSWITLGSGPLGRYEAVDLDAAFYEFRARAVNPLGYKGEWTLSPSIQTAGSAAPPADVADLDAEVNGTSLTLEWTAVDDLDLSHYRIRHAVETSGATWANSTTAVNKVPRPATSVTIPARAGTYLIRAVDKTGVESENATSVVLRSNRLPTYARSLTQTDSTTFTGSKTACTVVSSTLRLTLAGSAPYTGTYDFSTYIQTHDSTARRAVVRIDANVARVDTTGGLFDDLAGRFDSLPGKFDSFTSSPQIGDTDLKFYVSATDDDPAGTPTWTAYRLLRAGEHYGRAFRFRVVLTSTTTGVTPAISGLTAYVEYN